MTRRLLSFALLCYLGAATWMLTGAFATWGDDLSATVGRVVRAWTLTPPPTPSTSGIDFIECYGCASLPGTEGFGLGLLALLLAGAPLAVVAAALEGRHARATALPGGWYQMGIVVQAASVFVAALVLAGFIVSASEPAHLMHWIGGVALADIAFGVPAIFAWRRLQARSFGAPRTMLAAGHA